MYKKIVVLLCFVSLLIGCTSQPEAADVVAEAETAEETVVEQTAQAKQCGQR